MVRKTDNTGVQRPPEIARPSDASKTTIEKGGSKQRLREAVGAEKPKGYVEGSRRAQGVEVQIGGGAVGSASPVWAATAAKPDGRAISAAPDWLWDADAYKGVVDGKLVFEQHGERLTLELRDE